MIYGVHERRGIMLLLGEAGTGKTTLARHLLERSDADVKTVFIGHTALGVADLSQVVLRELGVACPSPQRLAMIEALQEYLLQEASAGRYVVLIIDEAQTLAPEVLEELRMLSNLEAAQGKLLQIVLAGHPELGATLRRPELWPLRQRISIVAALRPLSFPETCQ